MKLKPSFHSEVGPNPANCALEGERLCVEVCFLIRFHQVEGNKESAEECLLWEKYRAEINKAKAWKEEIVGTLSDYPQAC